MSVVKDIKDIIYRARVNRDNLYFINWIDGMKNTYINPNIEMCQAGLYTAVTMGTEVRGTLLNFMLQVADSNGWYKANDFLDLKKEEQLFNDQIYKNLKKVSNDYNLYKENLLNFDKFIDDKASGVFELRNSSKNFIGLLKPQFIEGLPEKLADFYSFIDEIKIPIAALLVHRYLGAHLSSYEIERIMAMSFKKNGMVYEESDKILSLGITTMFEFQLIIADLQDLLI